MLLNTVLNKRLSLLKNYFYFTCWSVCLHVRLRTMCVQGPQRPEEGMRSFGAGVTDVYELTYGRWELNSGPRKSSHCLFLTAELSSLLRRGFLMFLKWLLSKTCGFFFLHSSVASSPFCFQIEWMLQFGHCPELQQSQPPQPTDAASMTQPTVDERYLKDLNLCWTWIDLSCLWCLRCIAKQLFT